MSFRHVDAAAAATRRFSLRAPPADITLRYYATFICLRDIEFFHARHVTRLQRQDVMLYSCAPMLLVGMRQRR